MKRKASESVSKMSILVNLLLSLGKAVAGIIGSSQAMIADAVHSASDVISTVIVLIALKISNQSADKEHPYGHDRFESLASLVLAAMLAATGVGIGISAIRSFSEMTEEKAVPGVIALIAAVVSIIVKELMFRVTIKVGKAEKSDAVIADAWHHRSDALSSIGSLVGIVLSRVGIAWADAAAGILICVFILKTAYDIAVSAIRKLTDHACDANTEKKMQEMIISVKGVKRIDELKTRCFGSGCYVDLEISADETLSLRESHQIAENVHDLLERSFPDIRHCTVHVNPFE